jgi:hypothetical protein
VLVSRQCLGGSGLSQGDRELASAADEAPEQASGLLDWIAAWALTFRGLFALAGVELADAKADLERALEARQWLGDSFGLAWAQHGVALVAHRQGDLNRAEPHYAAVLATFRVLVERPTVATILESLGEIALARGTRVPAGDRWRKPRTLYGSPSAADSLTLLHEARSMGAQKLMVTHGLADPARFTLEQLQEAIAHGALTEHNYLATLAGPSALSPGQRTFTNVPVSDCVAAIRALGAQNSVLSSDLGQAEDPIHPMGLKTFITQLMAAGVTGEEIDLMVKRDPARLLDLS